MPRPVQLRHETPLTSEAYLAEHAWVKATLACCPRHPRGGCGFARHGTYPRKTPAGMRIARYYCPTAHETFSLLPDCLASRFPGDLDALEHVVAVVEGGPSIEAAADRLRPDPITLPAAVRWVRRRLQVVRTTLLVVVTLLPDLLTVAPSVAGVRHALDTDHALLTLRARSSTPLTLVPRPLGFGPHRVVAIRPHGSRQHRMGPDRAGLADENPLRSP